MTEEISFSPAKIQKQAKYYRIAIPLEFITRELINTSGLFEVILKKYNSETEIPFAPAKIQKQGNYYRIAIPPEYITRGLIDPQALYEVSLKELFKTVAILEKKGDSLNLQKDGTVKVSKKD